MSARKWSKLVSEYFDFLADHGFAREPRFDSSGFWAETVAYASATAAVLVTRSTEFQRVEVEIVRLVDGELPPPMIWYSDDGPFDKTLLDDVVIARAPERLEETKRARTLSDAEQLDLWRTVLREVAPDFLEGRFDALDEAREVVRERVRDNPQEMTIWLPESASPEEAQKALADGERDVPPGVSVSVRRYRQRG